MPDQRKAARWGFLVLLTGCGPPASERCWDIYVADRLGSTGIVNRNHTLEEVWGWRDFVGVDSMDRITERVPMPHVRAAAAWLDANPDDLATDDLLLHYSDSSRAARAALHLRHDSLVQEPPLPPRPSELRWYEENCYQGNAR